MARELVPPVGLATESERLRLLGDYAARAGCGLETDGDGLVRIHSSSVAGLHRLAVLMLADRSVLDALPKPTWYARAMEALEQGESSTVTTTRWTRPGSNAIEQVMVASSVRVSAQMSRLPRKDTQPEMALRRLLFRRGLRYRVHRPVPGLSRRTVDVVFPGVKVAVFVDGCFWHGCPKHGMVPKSNREWWQRKLDENRRRDRETSTHLVDRGWTVLRFWSHDDVDAMAGSVASAVAACRAGLPVDGARHP